MDSLFIHSLIDRGIELMITFLNLYTMFKMRRIQIDKQLITTLKEENEQKDEIIECQKHQIERLKVHAKAWEIRHKTLVKTTNLHITN